MSDDDVVGEHLPRRGFLTGAAAAAGAVATGAATKAVAQNLATVTDQDVLEQTSERVLSGLQSGETFGGYRVVEVHAIRHGGLPVVLAADGARPFQVDVLRRDESTDTPAGVFETDRLSIFVANWGDGHTATDEVQGIGARILGEELQRRGCEGELAGLLTWRQRNELHPDGVFSVLTD